MTFSPRVSVAREVIVAGTLVFLLLAGCFLLVEGLRHGGWLFTAGGCLIEAGYTGVQWFMGGRSDVERLFAAARGLIRGWRDRRAEKMARRQQASEFVATRSQYIEARVNELVALQVASRLAELETAEELRSQQEWTELRDVWRVLILDPATPEELRASCREWLAKYPETLDYLARRLTQMGLLAEKVLDERWEEREQHKWRVQ
ncbi:MAG TPA: hypothetical protein VFZ08_04400 [Terriglobia bacterium]|nr:hypothetical protein [Terriglobia bacterium]